MKNENSKANRDNSAANTAGKLEEEKHYYSNVFMKD